MLRKPFLKWAGGKFRILDAILQELPPGERFVEPFAGSCAVYLNTAHGRAFISDLNADLIALYRHIQNDGEDFIGLCQSYFTPANNSKERYILLREEFNASKDSGLRAAILLYLNRHSFNGLIRYNSKGRFNVPFGSHKKPYFPLNELRGFLHKTREVETAFACLDFRAAFTGLGPGDIVYCDPPYVPLSATANFTGYAGSPFGMQEQQELAEYAKQACRNGATIIISNHDTPETEMLYAPARIKRFTVQRFISSNGSGRVAVPELLAVFEPE